MLSLDHIEQALNKIIGTSIYAPFKLGVTGVTGAYCHIDLMIYGHEYVQPHRAFWISGDTSPFAALNHVFVPEYRNKWMILIRNRGELRSFGTYMVATIRTAGVMTRDDVDLMADRISRQEWDAMTPEDQWSYVEVLGKLYEDDRRVIKEIPECELHGECVPHAVQWVKDAKRKTRKSPFK